MSTHNDAPTLTRNLESNDTSSSSEEEPSRIEPGEDPDAQSVQQLDSADQLSRPNVSTSQSEEASFGTTGMLDRLKDKASEVGQKAHDQVRRVQGRSAARDARSAQEKMEGLFAEISSTVKGATQMVVSGTVGATYGVISGTAKGTSPMHAQTLRASDNLALAGSWSSLQKGVKTPDGLVDVFTVDFTEEAADMLSLSEASGQYPVDRAAVTTTMTDPNGERVQVVSSPLYTKSEDRMCGVLAFVHKGAYAGKILLHVEE